MSLHHSTARSKGNSSLEAEILDLIGAGRCRYPIGAASRWLPAAGPATRRIAEWIADLVHPMLGDVLARRLGCAAVAKPAPASEPGAGKNRAGARLTAALRRAAGMLAEEAAGIDERLAAARAARSREKLAQIAVDRKEWRKEIADLEGQLKWLRQDVAQDAIKYRKNKPLLKIAISTLHDLIPKTERELAAARQAMPAYRLGKAARQARAELTGRGRALREGLRVLRAAERRLAGGGRPGSRSSVRNDPGGGR